MPTIHRRMKKATKATAKAVIVMVMATSLVGCAQHEELSRSVGSVVGAVVGGVLGSKIGKGTGSAIGAALGVGLGGLLGNEIARQMTKRDREMASKNLDDTLENAPSGQKTKWSNPDSGHSGEAVAQEPFKQASNDCRNFETTVFTDEGEHIATGTACRNEDGSWQVVNEPEVES